MASVCEREGEEGKTGGLVCVKEGGIRGENWKASVCERGRDMMEWREGQCV